MYLTGLIQRDRLFEMAMRWLEDDVRPGDGRLITEIFIFEKLVSTPTGRQFLQDINGIIQTGTSTSHRISVKDDLRRAIVSASNPAGPRAAGLFQQFQALPEEFYPGTPADFILTFGPGGELLGMVRFKRIRRIAEKASRRIADNLAGTIRTVAESLDTLRDQGAKQEGFDGLAPLELPAYLVDLAEREVGRCFREHRLSFEPRQMRVDDLVGFKFVGTDEELIRVEHAISNHPRVHAMEREVHKGRYNDVNLLVDLELPPPGQIIDRMRGWDWSEASARGLDAETLRMDFPGYVEDGARTFRAEVILTTFDELVESEFGNAIHEQRVLEQRCRAPYSGRLAQNAHFIVEYLLMLAMSPKVEVDRLPVKLWGRYLPDVYSRAMWQLYGVEQNTALFDAILLGPEGSIPSSE